MRRPGKREPGAGRLRAGYGQADITPPVPCDVNGFVARTQPGTRVAGRLGARVLLLRTGRTGAVLAVCDLLGFTPQDSAALEAALGRAAGVPARHVLLACTHTHSGPMSMPLGLVGRFRRAYLRQVRRGLEQAARAARADLANVTAARFGTTAITGLAEFRCALDEPGRRRWPGRLSALELRRPTRPITLVTAGIHPYRLSWRRRVLHPDYPGPLCAAVARQTEGHALFLNGGGADVQPVPAMVTHLASVTAYGRQLAAAAQRAVRRGRLVDLAPVRAVWRRPLMCFNHLPPPPPPAAGEAALRNLSAAGRRVAANHRRWDAARRASRLPRTARCRGLVLRLGDLTMIGLPAEVFHDTAAELAAAVSGPRTFVVSQAGGDFGYLPRAFAYRRGTYEAASAHEWYGTAGALAPETEPRVRRELVRAARRLLQTTAS